MTSEEIGLRALRIAVISGQVRVGNLTVEQGKDILRGPLTPGDNSTIIDDSDQLITDESIERAAFIRGWNAGARAMKELCKARAASWEPSGGNWRGWQADEIPERIEAALRFVDIPEPLEENET